MAFSGLLELNLDARPVPLPLVADASAGGIAASPLEALISYGGEGSIPQVSFDLELFKSLNQEYAAKPVVQKPRPHDADYANGISLRRGRMLDRQIGIRNQRVLEIGCGEGNMSRVLAEEFSCSVVGVDVSVYEGWKLPVTRDLQFLQHDVSRADNSGLGQFDRVISFAVFEHIVHPHAALNAVRNLLKPGGKAYIYANLYRGAKASHRYREVFFPWPHLLFGNDVWRSFYMELCGEPLLPAWVNKWTYDHYVNSAGRMGMEVLRHSTSPPFFDEEFYRRFEYWLGAYPVFDLKHDFIHLVLRKPAP